MILVFFPVCRFLPEAVRAKKALACYPYDVVWKNAVSKWDGDLNGGYDDLTAKMEQARKLALSLDCEAMISFEDDIVPPPDFIRRIMEVEADIAIGLNCFRQNGKNASIKELNQHTALSTLYHETDPEWYSEGVTEGRLIPVEGIGFACTMFRRSTLEKIRFRRFNQWSPDTCCSIDVSDLVLMQHTGLQCGHVDEDAVLWPTPEGVAERVER